MKINVQPTTEKQLRLLSVTSSTIMKVEELITDAAIEIVFRNTNFGNRNPRDLIAKDLRQVSLGFRVGYTMQCCLLELGLIIENVSNPRQKYAITPIGGRYLEILNA